MNTATNRDSRWLFPRSPRQSVDAPDNVQPPSTALGVATLEVPHVAGRAARCTNTFLELTAPVLPTPLNYHHVITTRVARTSLPIGPATPQPCAVTGVPLGETLLTVRWSLTSPLTMIRQPMVSPSPCATTLPRRAAWVVVIVYDQGRGASLTCCG